MLPEAARTKQIVGFVTVPAWKKIKCIIPIFFTYPRVLNVAVNFKAA